MTVRIRQPSYQRGADYVAVRLIPVTSTTKIQPGEEINREIYRDSHIRTMHRRRLIGLKGDAWTEQCLAIWKNQEEVQSRRRAEQSKIGELETSPAEDTAPEVAENSDAVPEPEVPQKPQKSRRSSKKG